MEAFKEKWIGEALSETRRVDYEKECGRGRRQWHIHPL